MPDVARNLVEGASIVVLGRFNPSIFQPRWFSSMGLIRDEESDAASVHFITPEISWFDTEWFQLQVVNERMSFNCSDPSKYNILADLVSGTFEILEHTPLAAIGLNSFRHVQLSSASDVEGFFDRILPRGPWDDVIEDARGETVTVVGKPPGCDADSLKVTIEPSARFAFGVFISINEHYDLKPTEQEDTNQQPSPDPSVPPKFHEILRARWMEFIKYGGGVADALFLNPE